MKAFLPALGLLVVLPGMILPSSAAVAQSTGRIRPAAELELISLQKLWHSAYANGDTNTLAPLLIDQFTVTDSTGEMLDKKAAASRYGQQQGSRITLTGSDQKVSIFGDAAVITSRILETGAPATMEFRVTDTFVRKDGKWRVAASQWTRLPGELKEVKLSHAALDRFTGVYKTPRNMLLKVERRGDRLWIISPKGEEEEFLATSDTLLISPKSKARWLFVDDGAAGFSHAVIANQNGLIAVSRPKA